MMVQEGCFEKGDYGYTVGIVDLAEGNRMRGLFEPSTVSNRTPLSRCQPQLTEHDKGWGVKVSLEGP